MRAQLGLVAHESFVKSLELDSTSRETWLNLGQASRDRGDADAAKRAFMRCIATDPSFCRGHHALGLLMYGTGDFLKATASFKRCVALAQKEDADAAVGALYYAGLCWSALGVFEKPGVLAGAGADLRLLVRRWLGRFYGAALDNATADAEKDILGVFKEGHCSARHQRRRVRWPRGARPSVAAKDVQAATEVVNAAAPWSLVQLRTAPASFLIPGTTACSFMVLHAAYVVRRAFAGNAVNWREV